MLNNCDCIVYFFISRFLLTTVIEIKINKMQWVPLKTYLLPSIAEEIKGVWAEYQGTSLFYNIIEIVDQVKEGNTDKIQDYVYLRASIKARIEEINEFYESNINDPKIHYLEKYKLYLQLHWRNEVFDLTSEDIQNYKGQKYAQSEKIKQKDYSDSKEHQDKRISSTPNEERKTKRNVRPPSFSGPDVEQEGFAARHSQAAQHQAIQNNERQKANKTPPKYSAKKPLEKKELIFRIKLTPEEYSMYLHEKSKKTLNS